jgi:hypothetical protein
MVGVGLAVIAATAVLSCHNKGRPCAGLFFCPAASRKKQDDSRQERDGLKGKRKIDKRRYLLSTQRILANSASFARYFLLLLRNARRSIERATHVGDQIFFRFDAYRQSQ